MRSYLWCLMLPAFLNCSGKNVVAGTEKTDAEQLESSLPGWCKSVCSKFDQCEENSGCECADDQCTCTGFGDDCVEDCEEELARWAKGGDECAAVGERIKKCVDDLGCDVLNPNGNDCNSTPDERDACPKSDLPDMPGGPDGPSNGSGMLNTGGSTNGSVGTGGGSSSSNTAGGPSFGGTSAGGGASVGGTGSSGGPVSCSLQSTSGQAGSANSATICESGYSECSDNHEYGWYCVQTSAYKSVCSCLVDGDLTRAFEWNESCPDVLQVNVACDWHLMGQ